MPRLIALDLGAHSVKVATWRLPTRGQPELDELFSQVVPQDGSPPTLAQRLVALDALLDDHPSARPSSTDTVVLAWPASEAAFHRMTLPFSDRAQIERTLAFTLETEVPFDLDTMVIAWRTLDSSAVGTEIMAVLARKDRVRDWLNGLAERGFDPAFVHVDAELYGPWAESSTVVLEDEAEPPRSLVAVLDVGHVHTTVSVVRDGVVKLARSINAGGWAVTKAIGEAASVPWADAEALKHGEQRWPDEITHKVSGALGLMLAEIRSTLIKAEDALGGEVSEIRLAGGGSRLVQLRQELQRDLGVPVVDALDPRDPVAGDVYGVARAVGGVYGSTQVVDLRVGDLAFRGRIDFVRAALGYGVIGAGFFAVAALVMFVVQYRALSVEQADTEDAIRATVTRSFPEVSESTIQSVSVAQSVMSELTQDAVQRAAVLGEAGGVPPTIDTLYALTQAFPPHPKVRVELADLKISSTSISFNAETDGFAGSAAVEEKLQQTERFANAVKGEEQKLANGHVRFPITISLGEAETDGEDASPPAKTAKSGEEG